MNWKLAIAVADAMRELVARHRALAWALALGLAGGLVFQALSLPLPWMLGPLLFNTVAAMAGIAVWVPNWLRLPMFTVLGVMFGTSVSPDLMGRVPGWLPSLGLVMLLVTITMSSVTLYLKRYAGLDWVSAYFASAPGSLIAMLALGEAQGGDIRAMSLIHSVRVTFTVLSIPLAFRFFGGYERMGGLSLSPDAAPPDGAGWALLIAISAAGFLGARLARFPAPQLLGPMVLAGAATLAQFELPVFPSPAIGVAQLIIGAAIGTAFVGVRVREVSSTLAHAMVISVLMLVLALVFSLLTQRLTGLPFAALMLSFSPGGFAEMALVGFAMGIDVTFIITHQVARYLFVTFMAPIMGALLARRAGD